jgi:hypothetical protein
MDHQNIDKIFKMQTLKFDLLKFYIDAKIGKRILHGRILSTENMTWNDDMDNFWDEDCILLKRLFSVSENDVACKCPTWQTTWHWKCDVDKWHGQLLFATERCLHGSTCVVVIWIPLHTSSLVQKCPHCEWYLGGIGTDAILLWYSVYTLVMPGWYSGGFHWQHWSGQTLLRCKTCRGSLCLSAASICKSWSSAISVCVVNPRRVPLHICGCTSLLSAILWGSCCSFWLITNFLWAAWNLLRMCCSVITS